MTVSFQHCAQDTRPAFAQREQNREQNVSVGFSLFLPRRAARVVVGIVGMAPFPHISRRTQLCPVRTGVAALCPDGMPESDFSWRLVRTKQKHNSSGLGDAAVMV
jgi:hypothetical protein